MWAFIDQYREALGVEPICRVLQIAPSGYRRHAARQRDPARRSARAQRDEALMRHIQRIWDAHRQVYGANKVWRQLHREGMPVARCTVERLMRRLGLRGQAVRTTVPNLAAPCPGDHVNRQFRAERPNPLGVADFTYVSTWQGFVYVAFIIDVFARQPQGDDTLIHHSDRGSQYVSIRYSERLAEAGIEPSVGSTGDSYDNALAETINGLYKAEVIHRCGPWKTAEAVELATLDWVAWFNHQRLLEPMGYIPPAEAEANDYRQLTEQTLTV